VDLALSLGCLSGHLISWAARRLRNPAAGARAG